MKPGEFDYIDWLRQRTPADERVLLGPGDDAAALNWPPGVPCLVTTDMLMDGVCFNLAEAGPRAVGRKAMAVNLSDLAAMAAKPIAALVSVALPRSSPTAPILIPTLPLTVPVPVPDSGTDRGKGMGNDSSRSSKEDVPSPTSIRRLAEQLYLGLREMADEFQTAIIGGDTNSWDGPLVISVTAMGEATSSGPVRRSGAKPGDWLLVTGPLGGSIRGKHLAFTPRVREALRLHEIAHLHAMIDISDGLAADVNHLCEESHCGAVLRAEQIPITAEAQVAPVGQVAQSMNDANSPLEHALTDGEDFELVFAVSEDEGRKLVQSQPIPGITLTHIGECIEKGLWLEQQGQHRPLEPRGYEHELR
jgi:thiamine-monophosphate kinase